MLVLTFLLLAALLRRSGVRARRKVATLGYSRSMAGRFLTRAISLDCLTRSVVQLQIEHDLGGRLAPRALRREYLADDHVAYMVFV